LGAYVNDKVVSKTNAEWDRGKLEGWSNPPYAAWQDNSWKGNVNGGSGYTWNFRISWVGPCTNGAVMPDGGKCIWGKFEVLILPRSDTPGPEWFP